ncbi:MAG TPA: T9SS type A sorting domain-containing protein, partial [Bacteroidia bacterium]|nr:T9SS type A sorting domain-containing protein [Bacteroidia bacterium]
SGITVVTNVACNGGLTGAINLTPSGGTGPYTYNWLPSGPTTEDRTGLTAGTFSVQITDANGCTGTVNATVTQPASAVSGTTVVTNVACFGGSNGAINLTSTGGTGPYTYNWLPSGPTTEDRTGLTAATYSVEITDANGCTRTVTAIVTQPDSLMASTVHTNITCFGAADGTATVTVKGGTAPYHYIWTPSGGMDSIATGLLAGTYTCTIKDTNSCTITRTVSILEPTAITATVSHTDPTCFGIKNGTATVTANGGTQPYTYLWAPGNDTTASIKNLGMGMYTVKVLDASGCGITKTVTVTEPTKLVVSGTATLIKCFGEQSTISITASGATPPYIGTGIFVKNAGKYMFVVSDSNTCMDSIPLDITQPNAIELSQNIAICYGQTYSIGDSIYSTSGSYTNILKATNGCDSTVKTMLTIAPAINIKVNQNGDTLTAENNNSTYQWIECSNGNAIIPGATAQSYKVMKSGYYAVILTQNKCVDTSECVQVIITGIANHSESNTLRVFPNPNNGIFTIQATQAGSYTIVNELGQIVKTFQLTNANNYTTTINDLSNGSYSIIGTAGHQFIRQKVIVLQP